MRIRTAMRGYGNLAPGDCIPNGHPSDRVRNSLDFNLGLL
jgi:hypothetical protein